MTTPKYKVGQRVRIRSDLKLREVFHGVDVVTEMLSGIGEIFTIKKINGSNNEIYLEEIDYIWTPEMFDPTFVDEPTPSLPFQVGDICEAFGLECVVNRIFEHSSFPIQVYFKDGEVSMWVNSYNWHKWIRTPPDYVRRMTKLLGGKIKENYNEEYSFWGYYDKTDKPENHGYEFVGKINREAE